MEEKAITPSEDTTAIRPANWPPEPTQEQIEAYAAKLKADPDRHRPKQGRLEYIPEGHSVYIYRSDTGAGYDGRSAD